MLFGGGAVHELHAAEVLQPGSTRPQPGVVADSAPHYAVPEDPQGLATWMTTNALKSSIARQHRKHTAASHAVAAANQLPAPQQHR